MVLLRTGFLMILDHQLIVSLSVAFQFSVLVLLVISLFTIVIHRTLQRYYMKYFSVMPESSLQTLALDLPLWGWIPIWETFLDNADAMVEAYCRPSNEMPPTRIPEVYVRAIAEAFVRTPEAIALEAEITESFRTRFSFDEFLYSLGCGGGLYPGRFWGVLQAVPSCARGHPA
jgi:hypothetical protein